jgi:hypothetical protein
VLLAFRRGEDSIDAEAGAMLVASWGAFIVAIGKTLGIGEE